MGHLANGGEETGALLWGPIDNMLLLMEYIVGDFWHRSGIGRG